MPFCSKCGTKLDKDAKYCPKCGTPTAATREIASSEPVGKGSRRPMSSLTIALIVIIAVVVIIALISTVFFFGVFPFERRIGSGNLVTREEFISDFNSIDASSGFSVVISQSNTYSVIVTADDNVIDYVDVSKSGDTLNVGVDWGTILSSTMLKVEITMPELSRLELSTGSQGLIEDFSSDAVSIDLSAGSQLTGYGETESLDVNLSSGSQLDFSDFMAQNVTIESSGGSQATINVDGTLNADLSGGSQLSYIGDPTLENIETSGGSSIRKK